MELRHKDYIVVKLKDVERKIVTESGLQKILSSLYPYEDWTESIKELKKNNPGFGYGGKISKTAFSFQGINFLTDVEHRGLYFNREQLIQMFKILIPTKVSGDVIQIVNKTDQRGLERDHLTYGGTVYYGCGTPTFTDIHLAKRLAPVAFEKTEQNKGIIRSKKILQSYIDGQWQIGHIDPSKNSTADNLVMQPAELNRKSKDRWIFESNGLMAAFPTLPFFLKSVSKYYGAGWKELLLQNIVKVAGKEWVTKTVEKM